MTTDSAKVYFTNLRTYGRESQLDKLKRLMYRAGIDQIDFENKFVAIKIHFGELGNLSFLRPNYARAVADVVKELGGKPFLTDCNTLYVGSRKDALEHIDTAYQNGFTPYATGCQVIIADGIKGTDETLVPVKNGEYVKEAKIGHAHVLAALDRDERLVGALEAVGDDDLATRGIRGKAVLVGGIDVLERVFAATDIERVAVGEEGLATQLLHDIRDGAGVVGAQKAQVAQLAKVNLDGDELVLKVDLLDTGVTDEALELVELALASMRAQVGEVHLSGCCGCSCGHRSIPSVYMALQT